MLETDELGQRKDGSSANSSAHKRGKEGGSSVKMNYLRSSSWPSQFNLVPGYEVLPLRKTLGTRWGEFMHTFYVVRLDN